MKNRGFPQISFEEIASRKKAREERKAGREPRWVASNEPKAKTKRETNRSQSKESKFTAAVRKRDKSTCRFTGCKSKEVVVHHINERSTRPDLLYTVDNGICLCVTHHTFVHDNMKWAIENDFLRIRTYELAAKEGTLGKY